MWRHPLLSLLFVATVAVDLVLVPVGFPGHSLLLLILYGFLPVSFHPSSIQLLMQIGFLLGQVGVLVTWLTLGTSPWLLRWSGIVGLLAIASAFPGPIGEVATVAFLYGAFIALMLLVWRLKGYRWCQLAEYPAQRPGLHFSLRSLLGVTPIVAIVIVLARSLPSEFLLAFAAFSMTQGVITGAAVWIFGGAYLSPVRLAALPSVALASCGCVALLLPSLAGIARPDFLPVAVLYLLQALVLMAWLGTARMEGLRIVRSRPSTSESAGASSIVPESVTVE